MRKRSYPNSWGSSTKTMSRSARIRYADGAETLLVREIFSWERGFRDHPIQGASGPKSYIMNAVIELFEQAPSIDLVVMVRASGMPFLIMRDRENCWYDISGNQIVRDQC